MTPARPAWSTTTSTTRAAHAASGEPIARRKAQDPNRRYHASIKPRDDFLVALWNLALYQTRNDRRRAGLPKRPIWKIPVKCIADRRVLAQRYAAHMGAPGRRDEPHFADPRSVTRQLNGQLERRRLTISAAPRRRDRRGRVRGGIRNTITFTGAGKRYLFRLRAAVEWEAKL